MAGAGRKRKGVRVVVLDFDGVILESSRIKAEAYEALFQGFTIHQEAIRSYQRENGGLPRKVQIAHVHGAILGRALSEVELDAWCGRYSSLVFDRVMRAPFVAGALEFLREQRSGCCLYLASATPEEELRMVVRERGIEPFFRDVRGAPRRKADILRDIRDSEACAKGEMVFVGDSTSDREAAQEAGVPFIARLGDVPGLEDAPCWIRDLRDLPARLKELSAQ
jgi:phosphoglycolate phosphatase-like HAD superfamily hydrolase